MIAHIALGYLVMGAMLWLAYAGPLSNELHHSERRLPHSVVVFCAIAIVVVLGWPIIVVMAAMKGDRS